MVAWSALLLPIVISVVGVFLASCIVHMAVKWHASDYGQLPDEAAARAALQGVAPGQYVVPHCMDPKEMEEPEMKRRMEEGPILTIWARKPGPMKLGPFLGQWVGYVLVVSGIVAYLARAAVAPGADFARVLQIVGTTAWLAYAWEGPADAIWKGRPWGSVGRTIVEGAVYGVVTGAIFAWQWPAA